MSLSLQDSQLLRTQAYINGEWVNADSGESFAVQNPADDTQVAAVARCGTQETRRAVEAAEAALPAWQAKSAKERAALLRRLHDLMIEHQEDLAQILTAEMGKPLAEARGEIAYSASYVEWFAEEGKRLYGDTIPSASNDKRLLVVKQGIGVVACITPWNFPSAMLGRKIAPALAAGCTVVCKPANQTPLSAFALAVLAERAGIPAGVINIVAGHTGEIGAELTSNPIIRKLTFTGSTPVGKQLMAECAQTVKRTSMELGGNAPFIVFADADLDAAVQGALASKFRNAGQTCVCANRLLVHEDVHDAFVEKLVAAVAEFTLGDGMEDGVTMGPLIHAGAANQVRTLIDDALASGAERVTGTANAHLGEAFVEPTVLTGVTDQMRVFREEIFGPVAPVVKFKTDAEAIALANDTEFGLASYFYTRDIGRVWRVGEALDFGIVGINEGIISSEAAPFGGVKESGNGREGSKYGLDDYAEMKYLCMGGLND
jgi:succinate-semialdehyde dehydrogenase / glutarate-semialdehyde dehydrogenase